MAIYIQRFIVLTIIVFSLYMIWFYLKSKIKKLKNSYTNEMIFLMKMYKIDINKIGKNKVERDIAFNNSIIISIDLLLLFYIKSTLLKFFLMFIVTFTLIFIFYNHLAKKYIKMR